MDAKVDLVQETMEAITHIRDLVAKLTSEEKQSLASVFPPYRQLIESCRNAEIPRLENAIKQAIDHAGGRESEWGERAEECFVILERSFKHKAAQ